MESTREAIPDMALDDIIKSKKEERRKERHDTRPRGGFRGRGRGRGDRGFRRGGNNFNRPYRERSRERDFGRRRYSDEYTDYSRTPSPVEEEEVERPKKRIIIKRTGEGNADHGVPIEASKKSMPPGTEGFNPDNTIQIRNFPTEINMKDMITLFKDFGTLRNLSVNWTKKKDSQCTVYVEFSSHKEATRAKDKYNNADMEGFTLKISFLEGHS